MHPPKVCAPGVQSPPGVRPRRACPSRVQLLLPTRDTEQSLSRRPHGQGQCRTRGGGEALEPEGLSLTGSQLSTLSLFPQLVGQAGRRMGAVTWRHPLHHSWRHGSWSQSQQGHRVWGGTVQATGDMASPGLPAGELQLRDREPWRFVPAAQGRVTPTATCRVPPPGALAIASGP